jgi:hypothetical protein
VGSHPAGARAPPAAQLCGGGVARSGRATEAAEGFGSWRCFGGSQRSSCEPQGIRVGAVHVRESPQRGMGPFHCAAREGCAAISLTVDTAPYDARVLQPGHRL